MAALGQKETLIRPATMYRPLNRTWAKAEIFLGLAAAGTGLGLGFFALSHLTYETTWVSAITGLILFTLGGYLAMAGHRSHLHQSLNEQTELLLQYIQSAKDKIP
jgi:hypothetical protein